MATEDDMRGDFADADVAVSLRTPHLARVTHHRSGVVEWVAVLLQRVSVPAILVSATSGTRH